jgi:hypothetical protein
LRKNHKRILSRRRKWNSNRVKQASNNTLFWKEEYLNDDFFS